MTPEEGKRIFSNDYADLLINYSGDESLLKNFEDATIQIIDYFFAVVRVPIQQITDTTISELGYYVMPSLSGLASQSSLEGSGITKLRGPQTLNLTGKGVLIGILDTGIDYTNPIFINAENKTKILSIWDQSIYGENYSSNTYYGTEYTRDQINEALQNKDPFSIVPSKDEIGHGTMLAGIAAGNDVPKSGFYGVAPEAELVVVKLKPAKPYLKEFWRIPADAVCYQENDILFALEYLEQVAIQYNQPMVICVALGTSLDSHDGTGALSSNLSGRAENYNFAIVVAAGNEGNAKRHYEATIDPKLGYDKLELKVGENEGNFSMELWGDSPGLYAVDVRSPSGEYIPRILPKRNETRDVTFLFEQTRIIIDSQLVEAQSGEPLILFRFSKPSPGIWNFTVYGKGASHLHFNIWLPMEGFISNNTFFLSPNPNTTLLSVANSRMPITMTAYNSDNNSIYLNASRGYTRDSTIKPDLAAPGVNIVSPTLSHDFTAVTGSGAAAAHTAGVCALLFDWAITSGNLRLAASEIAKVGMIRAAKRTPGVPYPNKEWGYGILDVYQMFVDLRGGI